MGWQEKSSFLQQFEAKGGFKNLSWVSDFTQKAEIKDQTEIQCNETYMTLGQVLQCLGYSLSDFKETEEAVKLVEEIVAQNQEEHNTLEKYPPKKNTNALMNRYYYVHDMGKRRKLVGTESKKIEGGASGSKQLGDLHKSGAFIELLGETDSSQNSGSAGTSNVKDEHPDLAAARHSADQLRIYFSSCS